MRKSARNVFFSHISRSWTCKHNTRQCEMLTSCWFLRNMSKSAKHEVSERFQRNNCPEQSIWNETTLSGIHFSVLFRDLELLKKEYERVNCWHLVHFHEMCQKVQKWDLCGFFRKCLSWESIWRWKIQRNAFFQSCFEILNL